MKTRTRSGYLATAVLSTWGFVWGCSSDPKNQNSDGSTSDSGGSGGSSTGNSTGSGGDAGASMENTDSGGSTSRGTGGGTSSTGGSGGTGGDGGGTGGSAGAPPVEIPDPCDEVEDPEAVPDSVDEDLEIGPGCFTIDRTRVMEDATLTIHSGTTIRMANGGYLTTGQPGSNDGTGAIVAVGEADAPIKFTSAAPFPVAGSWQCIHVSASSSGSEFRHVSIEYGGSECLNGGQASLFASGKLVLTDSRIAHSASYGVELTNQGAGELEFANNTFVDNGSPSIFVTSNLVTSLGGGLVFATLNSSGEEEYNPADRVEVAQSQQGIRNGEWLNAGVPFLIPEGVRVGQNQAVNIAAGTNLRMGIGSFDASLGYLSTQGTEDDPVVFTAAGGVTEPGSWPCLVLGADAMIEHTVIQYAGAGVGCVTGVEQQTGVYVRGTPTLSNVTVRDTDGTALYVEDCANMDSAWCDGAVSYDNVSEPAIECGEEVAACG